MDYKQWLNTHKENETLTRFTRYKLNHRVIADYDWSNEDLSYIDFKNVREIRNVKFNNSDLAFVKFQNCKIINCDFTGSDLTNVTFDDCEVVGNKFNKAKVLNASMLKAKNVIKNTFREMEYIVKRINYLGNKVIYFGEKKYKEIDTFEYGDIFN